MAAILGLQSGAQPEMTCNQALLLTTVCPDYVLFEALYNEFSFFADYQLHQGLGKSFTISFTEGSVQSLKHVSIYEI